MCQVSPEASSLCCIPDQNQIALLESFLHNDKVKVYFTVQDLEYINTIIIIIIITN